MGIKGTRKILSVILSLIIGVCTVLMLTSLVLNSTYATQGFLSKNLITDEIVSECDAQLDAKYETLEIKSGIPSRVFKMVKTDFSTSDSLALAVEYVFSEDNSSLYNQDRVDYFYNLCVEYLEGNDISYKKANVENVAKEAAQIYSDTVGLHNLDTVKDYLSTFKQSCARVASTALVIIAIAIALLLVLYKSHEQSLIAATAGLAGGSVATALGSLLCVITKIGSDFAFEPAVYQQSMYAMTKKYFICLLLVSIIFAIISYVIMAYANHKIDRDKNRQKTRYSKIIGKF